MESDPVRYRIPNDLITTDHPHGVLTSDDRSASTKSWAFGRSRWLALILNGPRLFYVYPTLGYPARRSSRLQPKLAASRAVTLEATLRC
jgi:hypothetical protein